jgi:short-subunit dehydrogenase
MSFYRNKVVLITGASSGIGKALAEEALERGAKVVLCARRNNRLEAFVRLWNQSETRALAISCDVREQEQLQKAVEFTLSHFHRLDIVVANAGFGVVGDFERLNIEDYERQFETNVFGVLKTAYASLEALKASQGRFCIIGSVNSYLSFRAVSAYAMSKFAVRALADSLFHEWKAFKIGVTLVCPGYVESEIRQVDNRGVWHEKPAQPAPKILRMPAKTAAKKILKAISKNKKEIIITFHGKLGIFLQRYLPSLLHYFFEKLGVRGRRGPGSEV